MYRRFALLIMLSSLVNIQAQELASDVKLKLIQEQITKLQAELDKLKAKANTTTTPILKPKLESKNQNIHDRKFKQAPKQGNTNRYNATPVMTSSVWGVVSNYDGSDLIVSYSTMNQDLMLLKHRMQNSLLTTYNQRPSIQLSGALETQASMESINNTNSSDINLSRFELDILAEINPWVAAMASINYDDSATTNLDRTKYSSIYLKRAFVTLGKLSASNVYATAGQFYMPFGRYSSLMLTTPIIQAMGRTTGRGLLVGVYNKQHTTNEFNGAVYLMQGKTNYSSDDSKINQGGVNANYIRHLNGSDYIQLGGSWIRNIADSDHLRDLLASTSAEDKLTTKPGAISSNIIIGYDNWRIGAEYMAALKQLTANAVNYDKFSGLHFEIDKALGMRNIPSNIYISYDRSWNANTINLPKYSTAFGVYAHLWKNTLQALEFRHNNTYNDQYSNISKNMLLAQFGIYF